MKAGLHYTPQHDMGIMTFQNCYFYLEQISIHGTTLRRLRWIWLVVMGSFLFYASFWTADPT
jgi:hypothetical protein